MFSTQILSFFLLIILPVKLIKSTEKPTKFA